MSHLEVLIPIYAANDVAEVKSRPALIEKKLGKTLNELALVEGFSKAQEFVERLKLAIEDRKADFEVADTKVQIGACLRSLLRLVVFRQG